MTDKEIPQAGTGTKEAMVRLKSNHALKIEWGMYYAVKLAMKKLTVHSREVRDAMFNDGIISGDGREFWLGAIFKELKDADVLRKTGHSYKYSDEERGIHERTIALWELNPKADLTAYRIEPKEKP